MTAPFFSNWPASKWPLTKWFTSSAKVGAVLVAAGSAATQPVHAEVHDEYYDMKDTSIYVDNTDHDLQFFSPVDFDFENRPISARCGYFFRFDKLNWAATGERVTVGDPNLVVQSEQIFGDGSSFASVGTPPATFQINNSIQDAPPDGHDFAWGSRYEIGYGNGEHSWSIGILDGPDIHGHEMYGFESLSIPNQLPLTDLLNDPNFDFIDNILDYIADVRGGPGTGSNDIFTSRNGFGSVHVNFQTPQDYLLGFVDYSINGAANEMGPTVTGPGRAIRVIELGNDDNGNPIVTNIEIASGADGLPDDLNGNTQAGFTIVVNADGDVIATGVDYGDLHLFNIAFERFDVRNLTQTDGVELMKTFTLDNRYLPVKRQGDVAEIGVGVRYLRLNDEFTFEGNGGILGRTYATTGAENNIVGPQIRGRWSRQISRWNVGVDSRFVFGYNVQNQSQYGAIGEDLNPGGVNSPIYAQPHAVSYARQQNNFSPTVELRAEASYQITRALAARVGYTGIFVDNITRASQTVNWYIPDLGIKRGGEQEIYINGLDFGFDVVY
jgi:hypothetical protein